MDPLNKLSFNRIYIYPIKNHNTTKCLMSKFVLANMKLPQRGGEGQGPRGWGQVQETRENQLRKKPGHRGEDQRPGRELWS